MVNKSKEIGAQNPTKHASNKLQSVGEITLLCRRAKANNILRSSTKIQFYLIDNGITTGIMNSSSLEYKHKTVLRK